MQRSDYSYYPDRDVTAPPTVPWWLEDEKEDESPKLRTWLLWLAVVVGGIITGCFLWAAMRQNDTPAAVSTEAAVEPAVEVPVAAQTVVEVAPAGAAPAAVEVTAVAPTEPAPVVVVDA